MTAPSMSSPWGERRPPVEATRPNNRWVSLCSCRAIMNLGGVYKTLSIGRGHCRRRAFKDQTITIVQTLIMLRSLAISEAFCGGAGYCWRTNQREAGRQRIPAWLCRQSTWGVPRIGAAIADIF